MDTLGSHNVLLKVLPLYPESFEFSKEEEITMEHTTQQHGLGDSEQKWDW